MAAPFIFGRVVHSPDFTDRQDELKLLLQNFEAGTNSILISPRRWGKSSLVHKASELLQKKQKQTVVCQLDLFTVRTEEEFYQMLAEAVLKATHSKFDKMIESLRKFAGQIIPRISYSIDDVKNLELGLDWETVKRRPQDIIDLPERIAADRRIRIIICIDEFQNLSFFNQPLAFQKKLRAYWQKHKQVTYCLYGSKRHMMTEIFTHSNMPFYKFGTVIFLEKISKAHWLKFIEERFVATGKKIKPEAAEQIVMHTDAHPYYVQQLAQLSWLRCDKTCTIQVVDIAFDSLIMQLSNLFQMITDNLSNSQVNFLEAVINGEERLSTKKVVQRYNLGTTANVSRARKALIDREIIDYAGKQIVMLDPVYSAWLKAYYYTRRRQ